MRIELPSDGIYHHEDFVVGASMAFGSYPVSRDAIIEFARVYDPQPLHLDEIAAKASIVGGLCASGFHTCAIMMRMLCDNFLLRSTSLGSPGLDELKWHKPVRPGDTLSVRVNVLETRVLQSRPEVGISKMSFETLDQTGDIVLSATTNQMMRRRHAGPAVTVADRKPKSASVPTASLWDSDAASGVPAHGNFYEDVTVGEVRDLGSRTFSRDAIIEFARQFDPQPFHLDEEAGKRSLFGGLAASGWHTASIFIRCVVDARLEHENALRTSGQPVAQWGPSPGFRNLSWLRPVMAGDIISFRNKVLEKRELKSRPERGLVISEGQGRNQHGNLVYRFTGQIFVERRAAGDAAWDAQENCRTDDVT